MKNLSVKIFPLHKIYNNSNKKWKYYDFVQVINCTNVTYWYACLCVHIQSHTSQGSVWTEIWIIFYLVWYFIAKKGIFPAETAVKFVTKLFFSDNVEWRSKKLYKIIPADVKTGEKQQEIKELVAVSSIIITFYNRYKLQHLRYSQVSPLSFESAVMKIYPFENLCLVNKDESM